jgi:hypothetical protein
VAVSAAARSKVALQCRNARCRQRLSCAANAAKDCCSVCTQNKRAR